MCKGSASIAVDRDVIEGACGGREVLPVGLLTRPRSDRGRSCERVNAYVDKEQDKFFCRVNQQRADIDALKEQMERSELRARALELENESLSARLDSMVDKLCFCTRAEVTSQVVGSEISNGRNSDVILPRLTEPNPSSSMLMNLRIICCTLKPMLS